MVSVSYYCPRCEAVVTLDRDAYLADKSVTPYPLTGWEYVSPDGAFEDADGVRFVCGASEGFDDDDGCGEPFYLNFVRFDRGEEVDPEPEHERVSLGIGDGPRGPSL
ncbi:MAG: hypothetical protein ABEJ78_10620 [Haloferacaceae archaeon]